MKINSVFFCKTMSLLYSESYWKALAAHHVAPDTSLFLVNLSVFFRLSLEIYYSLFIWSIFFQHILFYLTVVINQLFQSKILFSFNIRHKPRTKGELTQSTRLLQTSTNSNCSPCLNGNRAKFSYSIRFPSKVNLQGLFFSSIALHLPDRMFSLQMAFFFFFLFLICSGLSFTTLVNRSALPRQSAWLFQSQQSIHSPTSISTITNLKLF